MDQPPARRRREQELDEEIASHLEMEIARHMEAGETREQAERAARRAFGNQALVKEATRTTWRDRWLDPLAQDLKYALRNLRHAPAFASAVVLVTALGIGACATVFSAVYGVLLRPLPYKNPERLVMLWRVAPISASFGAQDFPWANLDFGLLRDENSHAFESLGAFKPLTYNLTGKGEPVFLEGTAASAGFFPALGVAPALGRWFTEGEDRKGSDHVTVLSDRLWRDRFNADRNIIGRSIELNGFNYAVVGVMPPGFAYPHGEDLPAVLEFPREPQLWTPLAAGPGERGGPAEMALVARLAPRVGPQQLQAALEVLSHDFERVAPTAKTWSKTRAVSLQQQITGDTRLPMTLLLGAVGLLLLIACANVAGLALTRSLARSREFRLRAALGAGNGRLTRQILTENLLLAVMGGTFGVGLAEAGVAFVKRFGPSSVPRLHEIALDPAVLLFAFLTTVAAGLIFGLLPAVAAARSDLADSLKTGAKIAGSSSAPRIRALLLVGQVAMTLMLVIAAGLLIRSFAGMLTTPRGFRAERVLTFEISLPPSRYPDPDHMAQLYSRALHTLQSLPGVESAGLVHAVPMGGAPDASSIRVPGRVVPPNEPPLYANYMLTSPGFFAATGTPLLEGRDFADSDTLDAEHVTIVNRAMADALWPGKEAIGQYVGVQLQRYPVRRVIGVVPNVKQGSLREEPSPQMYVPFTQNEIKIWPPMNTMQAAIRTAADPGAMTASIRAAMHAVDGDLPLARVATLATLVDESLTQPRFAMLLVAGFGLLALTLASVGMYGVISHSVAQRTQELGIRMALGAQRGDVFRMVLGQGARLAVAGLAIGLAGAIAGTRLLSSLLFAVRPADPLTFAAVSGLIAIVALMACYLPARRATHVDPAVTLRGDS